MQGGWRGTEIERPPFVDKYLAGISTRRLDRLRKVRDLGGDPRGNRSGAAGVVDDVADFAEAAEGDGDHVVKADVWVGGNFDGTAEHDVGFEEDAVDAEAPGVVAREGAGHFVGGPAVGIGGAGVAGLVGGIVGDFGLVEVGAAGVALPEDLELLVVFDEEAVDRDVIAVDYEAVCAGVAGPSDAGAMIGAPYPGVFYDGVVAVDLEIDYGAANAGSSDAEKDIEERDRIFCVADGGFIWPNLKQDGRGCRTRVEEEAGDDDAVCVCSGHGCGAADWVQGGEAEAHHYGVGMSDVDGCGEFVDAWGEEEIFALGELRVDGCGVVAVRVGDVELRDRDGFSGCGGCVPGNAGGVGAQGRDVDAVVAGGVDLEEGLFADDGGLHDFGVGRFGPFAFWWVGDADEYHVPVCAGPTMPLAVA